MTLLLRLPFARQLPVQWQLVLSRYRNAIDCFRPPLVSGQHCSSQSCLVYRYCRAGCCGCEFYFRADVRGWPIFGFLATLQRTIFIERKPRYARQQMRELSDRLATGDRLILFPEGMSGDGNAIALQEQFVYAAEIEVNKPVRSTHLPCLYPD